MPKKRFVSGVIDVVTIIGVLFLIVTLGVGTYVISDKKYNFNIFEKAAILECFPAGTKIATIGGIKNIEEFDEGDKVLSENEDGTKEVSSTQKLWKLWSFNMCSISFESGEKIKLTNPHPLYTSEGWKAINVKSAKEHNPDLDISQLTESDSVKKQNGSWDKITSISCEYGLFRVYNLAVDNNNNYYAEGFLAHNKKSSVVDKGVGTTTVLDEGGLVVKQTEKVEKVIDRENVTVAVDTTSSLPSQVISPEAGSGCNSDAACSVEVDQNDVADGGTDYTNYSDNPFPEPKVIKDEQNNELVSPTNTSSGGGCYLYGNEISQDIVVVNGTGDYRRCGSDGQWTQICKDGQKCELADVTKGAVPQYLLTEYNKEITRLSDSCESGGGVWLGNECGSAESKIEKVDLSKFREEDVTKLVTKYSDSQGNPVGTSNLYIDQRVVTIDPKFKEKNPTNLITEYRDTKGNLVFKDVAPLAYQNYRTVEKTDNGFIRDFTTIIRNVNTNEILSTLTKSINTNDYQPPTTNPPTIPAYQQRGFLSLSECLADPRYSGRGANGCYGNVDNPNYVEPVFQANAYAFCNKAGATAEEIAKCNQTLTTINNTPIVGRYIDSYANQNIAYNYIQMGYESVSDCVEKTTSYADKLRCNGYQPSKEQLTSSVALGSALTAGGAVITATGGAATGALSLTQAIGLGMAGMSTYQLGTTTDTCIIEGYSDNCRTQLAWTLLSYANIGSSALQGAYQASSIMSGANTFINAVNVITDVVDIGQSCSEGEYASGFGCGAAIVGTVFDVGQGAVDLGIVDSIASSFRDINSLSGKLGALPDVSSNFVPDINRIFPAGGIDQLNRPNEWKVDSPPPYANNLGFEQWTLTHGYGQMVAKDPNLIVTNTHVNNWGERMPAIGRPIPRLIETEYGWLPSGEFLYQASLPSGESELHDYARTIFPSIGSTPGLILNRGSSAQTVGIFDNILNAPDRSMASEIGSVRFEINAEFIQNAIQNYVYSRTGGFLPFINSIVAPNRIVDLNFTPSTPLTTRIGDWAGQILDPLVTRLGLDIQTENLRFTDQAIEGRLSDQAINNRRIPPEWVQRIISSNDDWFPVNLLSQTPPYRALIDNIANEIANGTLKQVIPNQNTLDELLNLPEDRNITRLANGEESILYHELNSPDDFNLIKNDGFKSIPQYQIEIDGNTYDLTYFSTTKPIDITPNTIAIKTEGLKIFDGRDNTSVRYRDLIDGSFDGTKYDGAIMNTLSSQANSGIEIVIFNPAKLKPAENMHTLTDILNNKIVTDNLNQIVGPNRRSEYFAILGEESIGGNAGDGYGAVNAVIDSDGKIVAFGNIQDLSPEIRTGLSNGSLNRITIRQKAWPTDGQDYFVIYDEKLPEKIRTDLKSLERELNLKHPISESLNSDYQRLMDIYDSSQNPNWFQRNVLSPSAEIWDRVKNWWFEKGPSNWFGGFGSPAGDIVADSAKTINTTIYNGPDLQIISRSEANELSPADLDEIIAQAETGGIRINREGDFISAGFDEDGTYSLTLPHGSDPLSELHELIHLDQDLKALQSGISISQLDNLPPYNRALYEIQASTETLKYIKKWEIDDDIARIQEEINIEESTKVLNELGEEVPDRITEPWKSIPSNKNVEHLIPINNDPPSGNLPLVSATSDRIIGRFDNTNPGSPIFDQSVSRNSLSVTASIDHPRKIEITAVGDSPIEVNGTRLNKGSRTDISTTDTIKLSENTSLRWNGDANEPKFEVILTEKANILDKIFGRKTTINLMGVGNENTGNVFFSPKDTIYSEAINKTFTIPPQKVANGKQVYYQIDGTYNGKLLAPIPLQEVNILPNTKTSYSIEFGTLDVNGNFIPLEFETPFSNVIWVNQYQQVLTHEIHGLLLINPNETLLQNIYRNFRRYSENIIDTAPLSPSGVWNGVKSWLDEKFGGIGGFGSPAGDPVANSNKPNISYYDEYIGEIVPVENIDTLSRQQLENYLPNEIRIRNNNTTVSDSGEIQKLINSTKGPIYEIGGPSFQGFKQLDITQLNKRVIVTNRISPQPVFDRRPEIGTIGFIGKVDMILDARSLDLNDRSVGSLIGKSLPKSVIPDFSKEAYRVLESGGILALDNMSIIDIKPFEDAGFKAVSISNNLEGSVNITLQKPKTLFFLSPAGVWDGVKNWWDEKGNPVKWFGRGGNKGTNFGDDTLLSVGTTGNGTYKSLGGQKLVIDPRNDASLQQYLADARYYLEMKRTDPSISRVNLLNDFVHGSLRYANPDIEYSGATQLRNQLYSQGRPVKLGEFIDGNTGVCREFAACMHVAMADNGKPNYMTIGDVDSVEGVSANQEGGRHAWVEFIDTKTNTWMVADPTAGFVLPRDVAYKTKYVNVKNVEHEVFVWPEGTPILQKIFKYMTSTPQGNTAGSIAKNPRGQTLVELGTALPAVIGVPAGIIYYVDQYFDLGIADYVLNSINDALDNEQKPINITDPAYNAANFWLNSAAIVYGLNNSKGLSEIAITNPNQRPYNEVIQEGIDNYRAKNPDSDVYYETNPQALSLFGIFKQIFSKGSLDLIYQIFNNDEYKELSFTQKLIRLPEMHGLNGNSVIESVMIAAANTRLFTKQGGMYPIEGFDDETKNLITLIENEVQITGQPVSHSFVIEYFLEKNEGDLTQAILDSSNFEEYIFRGWGREMVDNPYSWVRDHVLDEYSPILPYQTLPIEEVKLENSEIYYDYSLQNRLGVVYHSANITALLNYLPPEAIKIMVIGEYIIYGNKHGLIKMSADLEILKELNDINNLLNSYNVSN